MNYSRRSIAHTKKIVRKFNLLQDKSNSKSISDLYLKNKKGQVRKDKLSNQLIINLIINNVKNSIEKSEEKRKIA